MAASFTHRELYCPAHFGNSYEEMWPREAEHFIAEAKWWGFNVYSDWFDNADMRSPETSRGLTLSSSLYNKKLDWFATAARHGLDLALGLTPNQVFVEQAQSAFMAELGDDRYYGQLLCPSNPQARQIILNNHRQLFEMFKARGLRLTSLTACPFDPGGCSCPRCTPWIVTFGKLAVEIHALADTYFPGITARLAGWWWTVKEHEQFKAWADSEACGLFKSLSMHLKYDQTQPDAGRLLPMGCQPQVFLHIGYGDVAEDKISHGRDVYGIWGPVVAPGRIPTTLTNMAKLGMSGYQAYSEGLFDDLNKAVLGGLSSGRFSSPEEVLAAYVKRYFAVSCASDVERWAAWIAQWARAYEVDVAVARTEWTSLLKAAGLRRSWRVDQLEGKLRMFEAHAAVMRRSQWNAARLIAANEFFAAREFLYRDVWKIGLVRGGLSPQCYAPRWQEEWRRVVNDCSAPNAVKLDVQA